MEYAWRKGARHKVKALTAFEEIRRIREQKGTASPETIVNESREEGAPLHPEFEWDDEHAADLYRRTQAGDIVRDLVIVEEEGAEPSGSAFVSVTVGEARGYVETERALANPVTRVEVLAEAKAGLAAWRKRYGHLRELASLVTQVDKALQEDEAA